MDPRCAWLYTVYDLPLFALCVLTNVGYVNVASFILSDERQESIVAGLRQIAAWNTDWQPTEFMSDFHEGQISAVESVFPGTLKPAVSSIFGLNNFVILPIFDHM